jgi:hypothetical protein
MTGGEPPQSGVRVTVGRAGLQQTEGPQFSRMTKPSPVLPSTGRGEGVLADDQGQHPRARPARSSNSCCWDGR